MNESHEYQLGKFDCLTGAAHQDGKGADYDAGYSWQHEVEQVLTADSEREA